VVESSALMTDLTDRMIELATAQLADWRAAGHAPHVSINPSGTDLEDDALASRIEAALARHESPATS
jgi:EAL domain-containing protein (putative c-di-GMP-specific phosphodiesterase class I)